MHEVEVDAEMAGWLCDKRMLRVLNGCLLHLCLVVSTCPCADRVCCIVFAVHKLTLT